MRHGSARVFRTSFGWAGVAVSGRGVVRVVLPKKGKRAVERELSVASERVQTTGASQLLRESVMLVKRALAGDDTVFDLPLDLDRYTTFQRAAWRAAAEIPFGETRTYGWIAKRIGRPKAARAVGQAMGANPIPLIVP